MEHSVLVLSLWQTRERRILPVCFIDADLLGFYWVSIYKLALSMHEASISDFFSPLNLLEIWNKYYLIQLGDPWCPCHVWKLTIPSSHSEEDSCMSHMTFTCLHLSFSWFLSENSDHWFVLLGNLSYLIFAEPVLSPPADLTNPGNHWLFGSCAFAMRNPPPPFFF